MRSDFKALLKVFGWSFALTIIVFGIAAASIIGGWLTEERTAYLMLGCFLVGSAGLGLWFGPALMKQPREEKLADTDARADRPHH